METLIAIIITACVFFYAGRITSVKIVKKSNQGGMSEPHKDSPKPNEYDNQEGGKQ